MATEITDIMLKKLLSPLRRIAPDSAYMTRSKELIAFSAQEAPVKSLRTRLMSRIFESMTLTAGVALASLLIVIALGSISYLGGSSHSGGQVAASFNNDSLALEAQSADFSIQIQNISYFDESARQVALALDKIAESLSNVKTTQ